MSIRVPSRASQGAEQPTSPAQIPQCKTNSRQKPRANPKLQIAERTKRLKPPPQIPQSTARASLARHQYTSDGILVIQYGLGPIGSSAAAHAVKHPGLELVGGVDVDPAKLGRDLDTVVGLSRSLGFAVVEDLSRTAAGRIGHMDLSESLGMVFHTLGRELTCHESHFEPVLAQEPVRTEYVEVQRRRVRGLR